MGMSHVCLNLLKIAAGVRGWKILLQDFACLRTGHAVCALLDGCSTKLLRMLLSVRRVKSDVIFLSWLSLAVFHERAEARVVC